MGAQVSSSETTINNEVRQSVKDIMTSEVNANLTVVCNNNQIVDNVNNCKIKFGDQTCTAFAISNVTSRTDFGSDSIQETAQNIKNAAESQAGGQSIFNISSSESSAVSNLYVDLALQVEKSIKTNCSKDASGINNQVVKNSSCLPGDPEINYEFASQEISIDVTSDCVVDTLSRSKNIQKLTQILDQSSKSKATGADFWAMGFFILCLAALLFVVPAGAAKVISTTTRSFLPILIIIILFGVTAIIQYFVSINYGIAPAPYPYKNGRCENSIEESDIVSTSPNYFPNCENRSGDEANSSCTENKKTSQYSQCGIAAVGAAECDDPKYLNDKIGFEGV